MKKLLLSILLLLPFVASNSIFAQTFQEKPSLPLHVELSLGAGTPFKSMIPVDATIDVNYTFFKKLSIHFVSNASYFIPKEGMTANYNKAFNIGGGIGTLSSLKRTINWVILK